MKKMNIKIFSRLSYVAKAALLVSLFAGCSLVTSEKDIKKNENLSENSSRLFKVSGKCSFEGNTWEMSADALQEVRGATETATAGDSSLSECTSSSRSAISSFSLADFSEDEISVKAYHLIRTPVSNSDNLEIYTFAREPGYSESETSSNILQPCLGSLDVYFNEWSVELNQPGWWEIEISVTRDGKTLLYGSNISSPLEIVEKRFFGTNYDGGAVSLKPQKNQDLMGSISLLIESQVSSVASLRYSWVRDGITDFPEELTDGILDFQASEGSGSGSSGGISFGDDGTSGLGGDFGIGTGDGSGSTGGSGTTGGITSKNLTLSFDSVKPGSYEVILDFLKISKAEAAAALGKGEQIPSLYSCRQIINVYSGFTTDSWYGSDPYLVAVEGPNGIQYSFVLGSSQADFEEKEKLASGKYPIILYDYEFKKLGKEFGNPKPGINIFTEITGGEEIGAGIALAPDAINENGVSISSFTIDPVTQKIYTLEKSASMYARLIKEYPSYAGYEKGGLLFCLPSDASLGGFKVYGHSLYVRAYESGEGKYTFYELIDGKLEAYKIFDKNGSIVDGVPFYFNFEIYENPESEKRFLISAKANDGNITVQKYLMTKEESEEDGKTVKTLQLDCLCEVTMSCEDLYLDKGIYKPSPANALTIVDCQVTADGKKFYILVSDNGYSCNRGGLIKVLNSDDNSDHSNDLSFYDFANDGLKPTIVVQDPEYDPNNITEDHPSPTMLEKLENCWIFGWTYDAYNPRSSEHMDLDSMAGQAYSDSAYFYGPKQFVARKPDELYIVDEGGYKYSTDENENNIKNKNRIVKINLQKFAMEAVDVNVGFRYFTNNSGTSDDYLSASSYN